MQHPVVPSEGTTLLIVEDEEQLRDILAEMLVGVANRIVTAGNGDEALALLQTTSVDCILSDFQMPNKTGLELLQHLAAKGSFAPFVMLTGHADHENLMQALRLGVMDFIEKPFAVEQVRSVITRAVEIGKRRRDYQAKVDKMCAEAGASSEVIENLKKNRKMLGLLQVKNSEFWKPKS